jgi:hypothetical protein
VGDGALEGTPPVSKVGGVGEDDEGGGAKIEAGLPASAMPTS